MLRGSASASSLRSDSGSGGSDGGGGGSRSAGISSESDSQASVSTFHIRVPSDRGQPILAMPVVSASGSSSGMSTRTRLSPVATSSSSTTTYSSHSSGSSVSHASAIYTHSSSALGSLHSMTLTEPSLFASRPASDDDGGNPELDPCAPVAIGIRTGQTPVPPSDEGLSQRAAVAAVPQSVHARAASSAAAGRSSSLLEGSASPPAFQPADARSYSSKFRALSPPAAPAQSPPSASKLGRARQTLGRMLRDARAGGKVSAPGAGCRCHLSSLLLALAYLSALFLSAYFFHAMDDSEADGGSLGSFGGPSPSSPFGTLGVQLTPSAVFSPLVSPQHQNHLRLDLRSARCSAWLERLWPAQSWRTSVLLHGREQQERQQEGWLGSLMFARGQSTHGYAQQQYYPQHVAHEQHHIPPMHAQQQYDAMFNPQLAQQQPHQQQPYGTHQQVPLQPHEQPVQQQQQQSQQQQQPQAELPPQAAQQQAQVQQPQQQPQQAQQQAAPQAPQQQQPPLARQLPPHADPYAHPHDAYAPHAYDPYAHPHDAYPPYPPHGAHDAYAHGPAGAHDPYAHDPYAHDPYGHAHEPYAHPHDPLGGYHPGAHAQHAPYGAPPHYPDAHHDPYAQQHPSAVPHAGAYPPLHPQQQAHHGYPPHGPASAELLHHQELLEQIRLENARFEAELAAGRVPHLGGLSVQQAPGQQQPLAPVQPVLVSPNSGSVTEVEQKLRERAEAHVQQEVEAAAAAAAAQQQQEAAKEEELPSVTVAATEAPQQPPVPLRFKVAATAPSASDEDEQQPFAAPAAPVHPPLVEPTFLHQPSASSGGGGLRLMPLLFYCACSLTMLVLPSLHVLILALNAMASAVVLLREAWAERAATAASQVQVKGRGGASSSSSSHAAPAGRVTSWLCALFGRGSSRPSLAAPRPLPSVSASSQASVSELIARSSASRWIWAACVCMLCGVGAYMSERRHARAKVATRKAL